MKTRRDLDGRTLVVNIDLTSGVLVGLAATLLVVALRGYMAFGHASTAAAAQEVSAAEAAVSGGLRRYYLTADTYTGGQAGGADVCAEGFHFASIWEIVDPSGFVYDTALGNSRADSGSGPPTSLRAWIRTGYDGSTGTVTGKGNCSAWSSSGPEDYGTSTVLPETWNTTYDVHVWQSGVNTCNSLFPVWCVED